MSEQKSAGDLIIGRASRHLKSLGMRQIAVPEWGETPDDPLIIWFRPITVSENQAYLREGAIGGGGEFMFVKAIIEKALDKDGNRLFDHSHRQFLLHNSYGAVIERIGGEIMSPRLKPETPAPPLKKGETPEEQAEGN